MLRQRGPRMSPAAFVRAKNRIIRFNAQRYAGLILLTIKRKKVILKMRSVFLLTEHPIKQRLRKTQQCQ